MSKRSDAKAADKAAKKAAKEAEKKAAAEAVEAAKAEAEADAATKEAAAKPEKSAEQKKRDEEKAKAAYLKEPLTSVQQNRLVTLSTVIVELRTDPKTTVGDLQAVIPEWEKKLDELKI